MEVKKKKKKRKRNVILESEVKVKGGVNAPREDQRKRRKKCFKSF